MAKLKTTAETTGSIRIEFPRTGNPWIDAGTVGLYRVLNAKSPMSTLLPTTLIDQRRQDTPLLRSPSFLTTN